MVCGTTSGMRAIIAITLRCYDEARKQVESITYCKVHEVTAFGWQRTESSISCATTRNMCRPTVSCSLLALILRHSLCGSVCLRLKPYLGRTGRHLL